MNLNFYSIFLVPMNDPKKYHAFISYSHADCGSIAPYIQGGIENIGKRWYQLKRNLHVFRDETNLSASPGLWPTIIQALDASEHFVLLVSPLAAKSKWVADEVTVWENKHYSKEQGIQHITIVLSQGEIAWDRNTNDFDWSVTDCLPDGLKGKFVTEPNWIDVRPYVKTTMNKRWLDYKAPGFVTAITKIIGAIIGKDPREIESDELRRRRRTTTVIAASIFLVTTILFGSFFLYRAKKLQERVSLSNYLMYRATKYQDINPGKALSLFYHSYRENSDSSILLLLNNFYRQNTFVDSVDSESSIPEDTLSHFYRSFPNSLDLDTNRMDRTTGDYIRARYDYSFTENKLIRFWQNKVSVKSAEADYNEIARVTFSNSSSAFYNSASETYFIINNYPGKNAAFLTICDTRKRSTFDVIRSDTKGVYHFNGGSSDSRLTDYIHSLKLNVLSFTDFTDSVYNNTAIAQLASGEDSRYVVVAPRTTSGTILWRPANSFFGLDFFTILLIDLKENNYTLKKIKTQYAYEFQQALDEISISPDNRYIFFRFNGNVSKGQSVIYDFNGNQVFTLFENNDWKTKLEKEQPLCSYWKMSGKKVQLFYGTGGGNVYVLGTFGSEDDDLKLPSVIKCRSADNYGAIISVLVNDRYIFAGTNRGYIMIWKNEDVHSQNTELYGYRFLTSIALHENQLISKLFFDPVTYTLIAMDVNGSRWTIKLKQTAAITQVMAELRKQLNKLEMDTLTTEDKKQAGL